MVWGIKGMDIAQFHAESIFTSFCLHQKYGKDIEYVQSIRATRKSPNEID